MILPVNNNKIAFSANESDINGLKYTHDTLLKNNMLTRTRITADKFSNALTLYPAKGLKGSKNSNFYEFLTMGSVPYIVGSLTLMSVFSASKHYAPFQKMKAASIGNKLALGVLFYGLMKNISKSFVNVPIKALTGIDTERPYAKVIYELPDNKNDTDITSIEYHKVFESVEFPRYDLLYGDETKGQKRNYRYDKIAKKLGLGDKLNDSDQDVKPRIREVVVKTNLAKNISSYLWAATGVCVAAQKPWENFFEVMTLKFWKPKEFKKSLQSFGKNFVESCKAFYNGEGKGLQKHAGKVMLGASVLSTILGVANAMSSSHTPSKVDAADVIKKDERYVVA